MIDYDKIGKRIREQRKQIRRVSQEKMAEDLGMYQADISNLEKAKNGSGITDLTKLELIADYFELPLETLLFGREDKKMVKYHGNTMQIRPSRKRIQKRYLEKIKHLMSPSIGEKNLLSHECGPYMLYTAREVEFTLGGGGDSQVAASCPLYKYHTLIFYDGELVALMTAYATTVMQHIHRPSFEMLQRLIPRIIMDVTDPWRNLNPYWALWEYGQNGPEKEENFNRMLHRMDELREAGEDRRILYIANAYVREDARQKGIFRMYTDLLKTVHEGCIIWLNMEPTAGSEMERVQYAMPVYTVSDIGQMNINAAIAEKVGFTVDPDIWHINAKVLDDDGGEHIEALRIRKCAYYFPKEIREILKDDGNLVELGRSMQHIADSDVEGQKEIDCNDRIVDGYWITEWMETTTIGSSIGEKMCFFAAVDIDDQSRYILGVSKSSVFAKGLFDTELEEEYYSIEAARESGHHEMLEAVYMMACANASIKKVTDKIRVDCSEGEAGLVRTELKFEFSEPFVYPGIDEPLQTVYIYGEESPEGMAFAADIFSILDRIKDGDEEEISTLEEFYSYESTKASELMELYDVVHDKLMSLAQKRGNYEEE